MSGNALFSLLSDIKNGGNGPDKNKKPAEPTKRVPKKPAADTTRKAPAKASLATASKPKPKLAAKAPANASSTAQKPAWRPAGVAPATPRSPLPRSPAPVQRAAVSGLYVSSCRRPTNFYQDTSTTSSCRPASSSSASSADRGCPARTIPTPPSSHDSKAATTCGRSSPPPVAVGRGAQSAAPTPRPGPAAPPVDSSRPSGRETPAVTRAAALDRSDNRLPPPPATIVHSLPARPPTPVRNNTKNTRQPPQAGRRQRRPLYDYVDTGEAELREDRTGIKCGYGPQTPHEPPKAKLPAMSPPGPDWKPVSPKPEQTRRPMWSSSGVAVELATGKQYTIPLDNTIPAKSNKHARPNRYGARQIVGTREKPMDGRHRTVRADGTLVFKAEDDLPEGFSWVTEQPKSASLVNAQTGTVREYPTDRWAFTGEDKSDSSSWRMSDDSIWRGKPFEYVVDHEEVVPTVPTVPAVPLVKAPRDADGEIEVDEILEDCWKPHPLEVKQAEARKQAELQEQVRRPEQRTEPSVPKVNHYQPPRPAHLPIRYRRGDTWQSLSLSELQDEAEIRCLNLHKDDDKPYLAEVMAINDKTFSECWYELEYRSLNVEQLRDEAIIKEAALNSQEYYNVTELLGAIVGKVAHDAVSQHNAELREKEIAEAEALKERNSRKARRERARKTRGADEEKAVMSGRTLPKRQDSHISGSSPVSTFQGGKVNGTKGKKRTRSEDQDTAESTPSKKIKASTPDEDDDRMQVDEETKPTPPPKPCRLPKGKSPIPRAMQARTKKVSSYADVDMGEDEPVETPKDSEKQTTPPKAPTHGRNTRSNKDAEVVKGLQDDEDPEMEDDDLEGEDMPKRKSNLGAMLSSKLFSGLM
jgi:hypothetical protein